MKKHNENSSVRIFLNGIAEKILSLNFDTSEEYKEENESTPRYYENYEPGNTEFFQRRVKITDPANLEEAACVPDFLLQGIIVTVNLENVDKENAQRVSDFICGASYCLNAVIHRISNHVFVITPGVTDLSGRKGALSGTGVQDKTASSNKTDISGSAYGKKATVSENDLPPLASYR